MRLARPQTVLRATMDGLLQPLQALLQHRLLVLLLLRREKGTASAT